ncbi:hypothetical protein [Butyrivibrio sp. AC2005]|uniref:hypothetical protein n=1 Tax=Butyrivibrio sp. AC2005 TaxID=1280672 RepID=UPI00041C6594|nr:hypothetical protein [Butyrivibrio sp. AC2005]
MFSERLKQMMVITGASNKQIADFSGLDASSLSRLCGGKRIPPKASPTINKITSGIYLYMEGIDKLEDLKKLISVSSDAQPDSIKEAMINWLYEGQALPSTTNIKKTRRTEKHKTNPLSFGLRLDSAMKLADYSNIQFSHLVNVDASLISRFRTGVRTPSSNPVIARRLSMVLWERLFSMQKIDLLAALMNISIKDLNEEIFHQWLCDFDNLYSNESLAAERLSESFDSFSVDNRMKLPDIDEAATEKILNDTRSLYDGYEGLRAAVLRFLGNAAKNAPKELLLYSDQDMEWMIEDPDFRLKWASLMFACVKNGTKIRIIHNIERNIDEMNAAIISWLPLYMTGMIESYYHTEPGNSRFSFTLFLNPGQACIRASHVIGQESAGHYHFLTAQEDLDECLETFQSLMKQCKPLMKKVGKQDRIKLPSISGNVISIRPTLSIATMPKELVDEFESLSLSSEWKERKERFEEIIETNTCCECIHLIESDSFNSSPVSVQAFQNESSLHYTKDQYLAHIRHLEAITEANPNYKLIPLPATAFANMELLICDKAVQITHTCHPFITIEFTHPLMCHSFIEYTNRIINQYKVDRKSLLKMLKTKY